jgi:response regulator RpfG family c-di-GMP phosphodiesterase
MNNHILLVVDDEEPIRRLLELTFSERPYRVLTASDGPTALRLLESHPVALVISDNRMPGMSGVELLREVYHRWPDCGRVLLTGFADLQSSTAAINEGQVHRFLTKPWEHEQLLKAADELIERFEMKRENQRLTELTRQQNAELLKLNATLEQRVEERTAELASKNRELETLYTQVKRGILSTVQMFSALLQHYDETLGSHSARVTTLARDLAVRLALSEEEIEEIEIAARLHDIGLICLPPHLVKAGRHNAESLVGPSREMFQRHPEMGQQIITRNESFIKIGRLVRAHHERYDGQGYPDRLKGDAIPLGARIIAIANQYDLMMVRPGEPQKDALRELHYREAKQYLQARQGARFDPQLIQAFLQMLGEYEKESPPIEVKLSDLREGMVLAKAISSGSGMLLISAGTVLQAFHLARLENFNRIDPITQKIYVRGGAQSRVEEKVVSGEG